MTKLSGLTKLVGLGALALPMVTGCVVAQAPGKGQVLQIEEPTTQGRYYLYLPEDYVRQDGNLITGKRWPLVVTFHGMKPFDVADSQIREWQQEADRYGFIVVAPSCQSPDLLREFPLRRVSPSVERDARLTLAVLNDVQQRVDVDPAHVLSTSWSSGGYLAHYFANRYPERFSCIAPRQSNFSAAILEPSRVPLYRSNKVGIFYTENDFAICREESQEGARWYSQQGFDVTFAVFKDLGHERRPGPSAAFFAETCEAVPKTSPIELARMQVTEVPLPKLAGAVQTPRDAQIAPLKGKPPPRQIASAARSESRVPKPSPRQVSDTPTTPRARPRATPRPRQPAATRRPIKRSAPASTDAVRTVARKPTSTPPPRRPPPPAGPVRVQVSSTIGIAPMLVNFRAVVQKSLGRNSFFLWTDNGEPISNGINGQRYLTMPGQHKLEVLMTTADGKEHRAGTTVDVLERLSHERRAAGS